MSEIYYEKKNGDSILLNEIAYPSQIGITPYRCKFSNGLMLEANFIMNVSNGYEHKFNGFSKDYWICCPFSVYGNENYSYPIVKLEWPEKDTFRVCTEFEGQFSIEYVAVGRWK